MPGKLDCIPISLPNPGEEKRVSFPKSGAFSYWMTTAKSRLIRTVNHRGWLCLQAHYGNVGSSASYKRNIY